MLAITPACSSTALPIARISLIRDYLPITALHALPPCSALRSMASLVSSGTAGSGSARLCVLLGSLFGHGVHFPALLFCALCLQCCCFARGPAARTQHWGWSTAWEVLVPSSWAGISFFHAWQCAPAPLALTPACVRGNSTAAIKYGLISFSVSPGSGGGCGQPRLSAGAVGQCVPPTQSFPLLQGRGYSLFLAIDVIDAV